ncbi:choice-of-anchor L domain-containing protein [Saprospiraceae bacterium]|nr:choice-of-anchor L domain-containing protein [Saprospiraceae bacterium]
MPKKLSIICMLLLSFSAGIYGQISVAASDVPPFTTENIIENVFLGNGVEVLNITYEGTPDAVGVFNNANPFIGIGRGIVLSTGSVNNINNVASELADGDTSRDSIVDEQLEELAGITVKDVARYTIDFIPTSDTLRFRYVFASEEYPQFQCSSSNDAFGFFIKGTNPNGPDYDFDNIALIPDPDDPSTFLDLPVTINNVNNGIVPNTGNPDRCILEYSEYYNDVAPDSYPAFNGYLDVFIAEAIVVPCEVYTIKIAIGDGREGEIDSAVFLEEKSFSTGSLDINLDNPGIDGGISEGCSPGQINLSLLRRTTTDFPIEIEVLTDPSLGNVAIPNVDFVIETNNLFIPQGERDLTIDLMPLSDNLDEDTEFIYIKIRRDICNVDTLIVPIFDNSLDFVSIPDTVFTCFQNPVRLEATVDDKVNITSPPIFRNTDNYIISGLDSAVISPIEVRNLPQEFLIPRMIAQVCIDTLTHTRLEDLDIFLSAPSGQYLELSTDNGFREDNDSQVDTFLNTCFALNTNLSINLGDPIEGTLDLNNPTYTRRYLPEGSWGAWLAPIVSESNGTYSLIVSDDTGEFSGELSSWSITFNATYEIDYTWSPAAGLNCLRCPSTVAVRDSSQYYYLTLNDSYDCSNVDSVWVEVVPEPEQPEVTCEAISPNEVRINWDDVPFVTTYEFRINRNFPWLPTDRDVQRQGFGVTTTGNSNEVIIDGLLPEEEIEIIFRGINEDNRIELGSCLGVNDTIMCRSLPCDNTSPVIDSINIAQPSCDTQGGSEVIVFAADQDQPLTYRAFGNTFTFENQTGRFASLPQGDVLLKVIDASGCITLDTIMINDPPPVEIIEDITNITCTDANDGMVTLVVNSENPPHQFDWSENLPSDSIQVGLAEGTYIVTVTDSDGCTNSGTYQLINPEPIDYSFNLIDTIDCLGIIDGSASIIISGGSEPYEVTWNDQTIIDTITGLRPGSITYQIEDANGCIIIDSAEVIQRVGFAVSSTATRLTCFTDTSAVGTIIATQGTEPYEYIWENGQIDATSNLLHAGNNLVTITDQEGCEVIETVFVDAPARILISAEIVPTTCVGASDGSIEITVDGGKGEPYGVIWFDGSTGPMVSNLSSGTYCVSVTDVNDCESVRCINVPDAPPIEANPLVTPVSCVGECDGLIVVLPFGGSGDFIYEWTGPDDFTSNSSLLDSLCVGDYQLTITERDDSSCSQSFVIPVEVNDIVEIVMQPARFISCYAGNDGVIEAIPTGGLEPFIYEWSTNVQTSNDSIASSLSEGIYSVTITDANGCSTSERLVLSQPDSLQATFLNEMILCYGDSTGQSSVTVTGGVPDYLLNWETGASIDSISNLPAGDYVITITDRNGCSLVDVSEVIQPENPINIGLDISGETCRGGNDGIVRLAVTNAVDPVMYSLDNASFKFDSTFLSLSSGDYTAYVVDGNNCDQTIDFNVAEGPELVVDLGENETVFFGESITLSTQVENNQGDIFYDWTTGSSDIFFSCTECPNPVIENITSSFTVRLVVTDEQGCFGEDFIIITLDDRNNVQIPTGFSPDGNGSNEELTVFGDDGIVIESFKVYNRYGSLVFQDSNFMTNSIGRGWDGTFKGDEAPPGTYTWTVEFTVESGRTEFNSGQTVLLR